MLDADGMILNWNAGAERLKGYGNGEVVGKNFACFYPEEDRAGKPAAELKRAAAEGRAEDEVWLLRKDGSRFWADVIITALLRRREPAGICRRDPLHNGTEDDRGIVAGERAALCLLHASLARRSQGATFWFTLG